jgi:pimeloyl-ACP methyl ester carboxylesterase
MAAVPAAPVFAAALSYRLFHPSSHPSRRQPADVGLVAEEVKVPFGANRFLHAWLCRGDPDRVVVLGHGLGLNKSAVLMHAKVLHSTGFTVCLLDHRNHGRSDRDRSWTSLADRFTADIGAVLRHLRAEGYDSARFAVFGFSFSTFASLYSLREQDLPVDAVICDSGPAGAVSPLFRNLLEAGAVPLPSVFRHGPAHTVFRAVTSFLATAMLGASWPPPAGGRYESVPMLFLTGERDQIIPVAAVKEFANRYPHSEVHTFPGAAHLGGMKADPSGYAAALIDFLRRVL